MLTTLVETDPELELIRARLRESLLSNAKTPRGPVDVDDAGFAGFVTAHKLVLVDVWAPWCGPCRILSPTIDALAQEMGDKVAFAKLNADENPRVSESFGVQAIPTLLLFKNGRLADRKMGVLPKAQLASWLERHAST